jgi:membrane-associated phospholipid phosphatase
MTKRIIFCLIFALVSIECRAGRFSIEKIGDVLTLAIPAYALGITTAESGYDGTIQFAESYLATLVAVETLRKIVPETRPNGHSGGFPSGHTSSAFSGATFIHKRYGIKRAIIPYILAGFTGFSRVYSKWHYAHDVIAGAAISAGFTWLLVSRYDGDPQFSVESDGTGAKVNVRMKF